MSLRRLFTLISLVVLVGLVATACKPDFPNCKTDAHCADSEEGQESGRVMCINGICQQCAQDADCAGPGFECVAGSCQEIPGYCTTTNDCPGNQVCRDNSCGPECLSDDDCADGYNCEGGNCVEEPECTTDADCAEGYQCRRNECVEIPETVCHLSTVFFAYDSSHLDNDARSVLQENAACIQERGLQVQIQGHCDERGTAEYNLALGNRRANAVRTYLTSLGVPRASLTTTSYGDQQLVRRCGETGPESCHSQNRRASFNY
jgi:peptidoglycan-associated lipoprotein